MMNLEEKIEQVEQIPEPKFSKEQILASKTFRHNRDLVKVLLKNGEDYTINEVWGKINNYLKGEVE